MRDRLLKWDDGCASSSVSRPASCVLDLPWKMLWLLFRSSKGLPSQPCKMKEYNAVANRHRGIAGEG